MHANSAGVVCWRGRWFAILSVLAVLGQPGIARSEATKDPRPAPAAAAILKAFDKYPLVALGEAHGLKEQHDFIQQLIRDPGFPTKVNTIVVEFGNAKYQGVIDRYVAGEKVPAEEVRQVWRNTTQIFVWDSPIYEQFFATVRAVSQRLPEGERLRVLLGDPPIDWGKVKSREDWLHFIGQRKLRDGSSNERW